MAERAVPVDIAVAPLDRALLDGVEDEAGGSRRRVDLAVLPCFEDERPLQGLAGLVDWRLGGALSALVRQGLCTGRAGEAVLMPGRRTLPMERLVVLGLGSSAAFDRARAERTGERLVTMVQRLRPRDVLVAMPGRVAERAVVEAVFDGLVQALRRSSPGPDPAVPRPAVRAVGDDSAAPPAAEPAAEGSAPTDRARTEDGVVALEAVSDARPGSFGPPGGQRWWVVTDPRHEARLRRLLEGPPRAAEQGA